MCERINVSMQQHVSVRCSYNENSLTTVSHVDAYKSASSAILVTSTRNACRIGKSQNQANSDQLRLGAIVSSRFGTRSLSTFLTGGCTFCYVS